LLIPKKSRNIRDEIKIRKRLKEHFHRHFIEKKEEIRNLKREGAIWFFVGTCLMLLSAFIYGKTDFIFKLFEVMLVPAGWFMFWEGLDKIFIAPKDKEPDYHFYRKMAHCQIFFFNY
jgi:hypothetical protein